MFVSPYPSRMTSTGHGAERTMSRPNGPGTLAGWKRTRSPSAQDSWRKRTRRSDRKWPTCGRNSAAVRTFWPNTRRDTALCEPLPSPHKPRPHPQMTHPPGTSACPFKRHQILLEFFHVSLSIFELTCFSFVFQCLSFSSQVGISLLSLSFYLFVRPFIPSPTTDRLFGNDSTWFSFSLECFQTRTDKYFPLFSPSCLSIIRSVHPPLPRGSAHFLLLELIFVYIIVF